MALKDFIFTSESVSEGHPDKICDQISDAVLDAFLKCDPRARVACETMVTTNRIVVAGEVTARNGDQVDVEAIARQVCREIGYTHADIGFDADSAQVDVYLHEQSPDIAQGVDEGSGLFKEQGAGDQGLMFGFANRETDEMMPMPVQYSHRLVQHLANLRHNGTIDWLRPDSKSQVTVKYREGQPVEVDTVVISTHHAPGVAHATIKEAVVEEVVKKMIPANLLENTKFFINPTGEFVVGGPHGDCGLTGRKIIVDTYGGYARHGGGAFSGKDPSKVDRSAAYMGRYIAKNIVAAGLADQCEVQLAYAIGVPEPVSVLIDTFGTEKGVNVHDLEARVRKVFDLSPAGIIKSLELIETGRVYRETAAYGHFGRTGKTFTWEQTNKVEALKG